MSESSGILKAKRCQEPFSPRVKKVPDTFLPPDVSVCIANWNCRAMLRACLESLRDQPQGVCLETIVVDNASTDGAADMVARDFPEVVLIRNPVNAGFSRACNQAAEHARGRYLFFLNNDTVVPPHTLGRLLAFAQAHPEAGMIGPRLRDLDGRTQVSCRPRPTVRTLLHRTHLLRWTGLLRNGYQRYRRLECDVGIEREVETLMGAAMFLRREVFFACGRWDEEYTFGGEDFDLSTRIGRRYRLLYLPSVAIIHHGRSSTRANAIYSSPNIAIGFARYLRKSGCSPAAVSFYKLVLALDAPVQFAVKGVQYLWRRAQGKRAKAEKSLLAAKTMWYIMTRGLLGLWKA